MRIAILGTKGVPCRYGGMEMCAQEVSIRLAARGHDVTVYGDRTAYPELPSEYLGVRLKHMSSFRSKHFHIFLPTAFATLHSLRHKPDVVLMFNVAHAPFIRSLTLSGIPVVTNVDGMDWLRLKWGWPARLYYRWSAAAAARWSSEIVCDSRVIQRHYSDQFGVSSEYIPYGALPEQSQNPGLIGERFGLEPNHYALIITRLEPENNVHVALEAWALAAAPMPLVIVGWTAYRSPYVKRLKRNANGSSRFLGPIYDQTVLQELRCNSAAYIHGCEVGGTNPALLQAMASGCNILALDNPFNREALSDTGRYFPKNPEALLYLLKLSIRGETQSLELRARARDRALALFSWDAVTESYERILTKTQSRRIA